MARNPAMRSTSPARRSSARTAFFHSLLRHICLMGESSESLQLPSEAKRPSEEQERAMPVACTWSAATVLETALAIRASEWQQRWKEKATPPERAAKTAPRKPSVHAARMTTHTHTHH